MLFHFGKQLYGIARVSKSIRFLNEVLSGFSVSGRFEAAFNATVNRYPNHNKEGICRPPPGRHASELTRSLGFSIRPHHGRTVSLKH